MKKEATGRTVVLQKKKRPIISRDVVASIELEALEKVGPEKLSPQLELLGVFPQKVPYFPDRPVYLSVPCHWISVLAPRRFPVGVRPEVEPFDQSGAATAPGSAGKSDSGQLKR